MESKFKVGDILTDKLGKKDTLLYIKEIKDDTYICDVTVPNGNYKMEFKIKDVEKLCELDIIELRKRKINKIKK